MLLQETVEDVVSHLYMRESYYLDPKKVKRSQLVRLVGMIVDQINGIGMNTNKRGVVGN